jgi:hypothetical protein
MRRISVKSSVLAVVVILAGAQPALAYIDPSTGGMLFQVLAAVFAFFTGFVLLFSARLRMIFARLTRFVRSRARR